MEAILIRFQKSSWNIIWWQTTLRQNLCPSFHLSRHSINVKLKWIKLMVKFQTKPACGTWTGLPLKIMSLEMSWNTRAIHVVYNLFLFCAVLPKSQHTAWLTGTCLFIDWSNWTFKILKRSRVMWQQSQEARNACFSLGSCVTSGDDLINSGVNKPASSRTTSGRK